MTRQLAPAKVNLTLHVTGRRDDGLHLLDSIVCFADVGDYVSARADHGLSLGVTGPLAAAIPSGGANLVLRAARLLAPTGGARILLEKHLPVAAGIGGGSADAATALHVLSRLWGCDLPRPEAIAQLGADVPVCMDSRAARVRGIGERLTPLPDMPAFHGVLVNPGKPLATANVFRTAPVKVGPALEDIPQSKQASDWIDYLDRQRNDLEAPAITLVPEIRDVLMAIKSNDGCRLVRMSGSGATCFGLFDGATAASAAAKNLGRARPDWWVVPTCLNGPHTTRDTT